MMPDEQDRSHWPTPEIPEPPVSAETHGDPSTWTMFEWIPFREWALSLKDYGPAPRKKRKRDDD